MIRRLLIQFQQQMMSFCGGKPIREEDGKREGDEVVTRLRIRLVRFQVREPEG